MKRLVAERSVGPAERFSPGRPGGSAQRFSAERWESERSFHHSLYSVERIAAERERSVSVCLPARECAATVGEIVGRLCVLREGGAIDEIVVVDAASPDGTAAVAERAGARVLQEAELMPSFGGVLGKGDAMWRALSVLSGELVLYMDADSSSFSEHFATGLLGPLVCEPGVQFVKAFYRRPFEHEGVSLPEGGGRVNHLMARPALRVFYPELAGVRQPLAGEVGARRELLERIPFATGYGVEVGMLIDVWREVGLEGMGQVDVEEHRNPHQSLPALSKMAETVLCTILTRAASEGRLSSGGRGGVAPGVSGVGFAGDSGVCDPGAADDVEPQATGCPPGGPHEGAVQTAGCPPERPPLAGVRFR